MSNREIVKSEFFQFRTTKRSDGMVWVRVLDVTKNIVCGRDSSTTVTELEIRRELAAYCKGTPKGLTRVRGYGARLGKEPWTLFSSKAEAEAHLDLVESGEEVDIFDEAL